MLKNKKIIVSTLVSLLPILVGLILWNRLPDTVPIHWNAKGEIDGYAPKIFAIIAMPIFLSVLNVFCIWITQFDNKNREQNKKLLSLTYWICPAVSIIVSGLIYCTAFDISFNSIKILPVALGILFFFIGNYMPKCRYNHTVGIRIPTTLRDEENWDRTHYFAGKIWVVGSILIVLTALLPENYIVWIFLPIILIMAFVPMLYSVIISKKK